MSSTSKSRGNRQPLIRKKVKKPSKLSVVPRKNNDGTDRKKIERSPHVITQIELRAQALELRKAGLTFKEIGKVLGVSMVTASNYVQAELLEIREKAELDATLLRDIELERCDYMLKKLWPQCDDPFVVDRIIKIMERRSKLLGLDAPNKTELTGALAAITPEAAAKMSDGDLKERISNLVNRLTAGGGV